MSQPDSDAPSQESTAEVKPAHQRDVRVDPTGVTGPPVRRGAQEARRTAGFLMLLASGVVCAAIAAGGSDAQSRVVPLANSAAWGDGGLKIRPSASKILAGQDVSVALEIAVPTSGQEGRPATDVALVLDRSGSMAGEKLAQAKIAALALVERFDARDRIALIQYDDEANILVPLTAMDSVGKQKVSAAISEIRENSGTNLSAGLSLAVSQLSLGLENSHVNRVILLSDGQANVGVVDPQIISTDAKTASEKGIRISTVGLGSDYNEDLMEAIAESGRGQYYYVQNAQGISEVLTGEFRALQKTVARRAEIRFVPKPGVTVEKIYGYSFSREGNEYVVPLADLAAGEQRKMVLKLRIEKPMGNGDFLSAAMTFEDMKTHRIESLHVHSQVGVAQNAMEADKSVNKDVVAMVVEAESAETLRLAATAYEQGRRAEAETILREQNVKNEEIGLRYQIDKDVLAKPMGVVSQMAADVAAYDGSSDEGKMARKANKKAAIEFSRQSSKKASK